MLAQAFTSVWFMCDSWVLIEVTPNYSSIMTNTNFSRFHMA